MRYQTYMKHDQAARNNILKPNLSYLTTLSSILLNFCGPISESTKDHRHLTVNTSCVNLLTTSNMGSSRYDRAITVFSPDGHLFQVEYAQEAVKKGSTAVGVRGDSVVVLAVEKKSVAKLQVDRTMRKICSIDNHVFIAFAGLTADARILIDRAKTECQSHKLTVEDRVSLEYITRFIAQLKQKYTQSNGKRPFGISALITGFDEDGTPRLFQTDPSGVYHEWKANSTGRSAQTVREFLEKNYTTEIAAKDDQVIKLAIRALLEVVQGKNLEVAIMKHETPMKLLTATEVDAIVAEIEKEKEEMSQKI